MNEVIKKDTALELPGALLLVITLAARGLTGATAIATALAVLGELAVFKLTRLILSLPSSSRG